MGLKSKLIICEEKVGSKSKLLICEENYYGVKVQITMGLKSKLLICEEKSQVKVQITNL